MVFVLSLSLPIVALILVHRSGRAQSPRRKALALTAVIVLAPPGTAPAFAAPEGDAPTGEAKALFRRYCLSCHGADGKGDASGAVTGLPDFTRPLWQRKRSDAQLAVSIRDGKGSEMPPFGDRLTAAQVKSLVAHVRGFASPPPGPAPVQPAAQETSEASFDVRYRQLEKELEDLRKQIKALDPPRREREKVPAPEGDRGAADKPAPREAVVLYRKLCQRCHGPEGKGEAEMDGMDDVPDFTRRAWQERRSDAQLLKSILDGTEGGMPPFRKQLSAAEAKALVARVRQFAGTPGKPGNKATQPSPKRGPEQSPTPAATALSPPPRPRTGQGS